MGSTTWTPEQVVAYANKSQRKLQTAKPQPVIRDALHAEVQGEVQGALRIVVRVKSFRSELLDTDNVCAKYLVDGLRYAGLIPDDRPQDIELIVTQEKCRPEEERTEIELVFN